MISWSWDINAASSCVPRRGCPRASPRSCSARPACGAVSRRARGPFPGGRWTVPPPPALPARGCGLRRPWRPVRGDGGGRCSQPEILRCQVGGRQLPASRREVGQGADQLVGDLPGGGGLVDRPAFGRNGYPELVVLDPQLLVLLLQLGELPVRVEFPGEERIHPQGQHHQRPGPASDQREVVLHGPSFPCRLIPAYTGGVVFCAAVTCCFSSWWCRSACAVRLTWLMMTAVRVQADGAMVL